MEQPSYSLEAYNILNEIETMLEGLRKVPFSNSFAIDRDSALDLVAELRESLPAELRDAASLVRQQTRIIQNANRIADSKVAEAESSARQILQDAQNQADAIISESEQRATDRETLSQEQAQRTIESAERKAEERTNQTAILKRAEQQANDLMNKAQQEAQRIYSMNLDHCEMMLKQIEDRAIEIADQLRRSRNELSEAR
ncbi:MAG: hypothetical protein LBD16_01540 [Oscillospiraceae bacterium]|jgi:vacuolar-type H+-ATPase subunit H|nr:hypothetical protein [Oscillospiraceae bacterium]